MQYCLIRHIITSGGGTLRIKGGLQNGGEEGGGVKSPQAITIYNLRHKVEKGNTFSSKDQTSLKFSFSEYFF